MVAVSSFRFRIDLAEPDLDDSPDVLLAGERLATGYNAKVGDVIAVPTASGAVRCRITGFPLINYVDRSWIGMTVSGVDAPEILLGGVADIRAADQA
jgi:hypothetical protein